MNNEASGRNGLGAKLVNIMSEIFAIQVENRGIRFTAIWHQGVLYKAETITAPTITQPSFTAMCRLLPMGTKL